MSLEAQSEDVTARFASSLMLFHAQTKVPNATCICYVLTCLELLLKLQELVDAHSGCGCWHACCTMESSLAERAGSLIWTPYAASVARVQSELKTLLAMAAVCFVQVHLVALLVPEFATLS